MGVADIGDFFPRPCEFAQEPVGRIATLRRLARAAAKKAPQGLLFNASVY